MSEGNAGISICRRNFSQGSYSNIIFPLVNPTDNLQQSDFFLEKPERKGKNLPLVSDKKALTRTYEPSGPQGIFTKNVGVEKMKLTKWDLKRKPNFKLDTPMGRRK